MPSSTRVSRPSTHYSPPRSDMFPILLMIGTGVATAIAVMMTVGIVQRASRREAPTTSLDSIASSILFELLLAGGDRNDEALRDIRRIDGLGGSITPSVDIAGWG